jgi:phosphatidylserine decarboxylase
VLGDFSLELDFMVRDGYWYGLPLVLVAGGLLGFKIYWLGAVFLVLALLVLNFFRDPDREIPSDDRALISPADGRIVQIQDEIVDGHPKRRLSIFMSPLDVHVNRSPISGVVQRVEYKKGSFHVASQGRASVENEQNIFTIQGDQGEVTVRQIAGLLARRIVFWKRAGDTLVRGERVGLIKFGSRVDVLVEPDVELRVRVGDRVLAGSSILGFTKFQF